MDYARFGKIKVSQFLSYIPKKIENMDYDYLIFFKLNKCDASIEVSLFILQYGTELLK